MKEKRNVHLKVQELCDCYATNDPLKEMSVVKNGSDKEEAALKWLALASLHGNRSSAGNHPYRRRQRQNSPVPGNPQ
jgi:hypothetical protein